MLLSKVVRARVGHYPRDHRRARFAACREPQMLDEMKAPRSDVDRISPATKSFSQVRDADQTDAPAAAPGRQRLLTVRSPRIHRRMSSCAVTAISAAISEAFS